MDSTLARALTVLDSLIAIADPRARHDTIDFSALSAFISFYNATTRSRPLTMSPATPEDHLALFHAALDIVCAIMNIQYGGDLDGYVQNFEVIALLTRPTIAYTPMSYSIANSIRVCTVNPTATAGYRNPFSRGVELGMIGLARLPAGQGAAQRLVSKERLEVVVAQGQHIARAGMPVVAMNDHVWCRVTWRPMIEGLDANGAVINLSQNINVTLDGAAWPAGTVRVVGRNQAVGIANNGAMIGIAVFEVLEFARAHSGIDSNLTARADLNSMWTFGDDRWHAIRTNILNALDIRPEYPPFEPAWDAKYATTNAVVGRLFRVYAAHGLIMAGGAGGAAAVRDRARDVMAQV